MLRSYLDLPRPVHLLCLGALVNRAGAVVMPFLALYLTRSRGFSADAAAQIMGAFGLGTIFAALVGGDLADRVGRRPVMVASLLGSAAAITAIPRMDGEGAVFAAVLLLALATDAYRPAASAMLSDVAGPDVRPRAYALFYAAINLGFTVGASVGGWIVVAWSYDVLFVVEAVSALVFAVFIALALPETRPAAPPRADGPRAGGALASMLGNRTFLVFLAANWAVALSFNQAFSTLPLYMSHIGIAPDVYGRIMAVNGAMIVVGQLPLTDRVTRWARGTVMVAGALLLAAGMGLTGAFDTAAGMTATVVLWTVGEMCLAAVTQAVVSDLAPVAFRARYFGAFTMTVGVAMAAGPPAGGWLLARHGGGALWAAVAALGATSALALWIIRDRLRASPAPVPRAEAASAG